MTDSGFHSTVAYLHPQGIEAPATKRLVALQQEARREGREKDADEYGRMLELAAGGAREEQGEVPLHIKAAVAAVFALVLVLAIRFLVR
jgi:hypothetical protein